MQTNARFDPNIRIAERELKQTEEIQKGILKVINDFFNEEDYTTEQDLDGKIS